MTERLTLTDYASAAGAHFALWLFGRLPVETASTFGGWLARKLGPRFRAHRYATENLARAMPRSEEHTSELQSLMRISYAVFCLKKKNSTTQHHHTLIPSLQHL